MKKERKIIVIILVIIGILVLDTAQALIFNNSPIIKVREHYNGGIETTLKDALKNGIVEIGGLDKFEIDYIKYAK